MKEKKSKKPTLSDNISAALTVAPRPDLEDDHVFQTKPQFTSRDQFSDSDDDFGISEFRRQNVQLLSDISDKYKGEVVSKRDVGLHSDSETCGEDIGPLILESDSDASIQKTDNVSEQDDDSAEESDNYDITRSQTSYADSEEENMQLKTIDASNDSEDEKDSGREEKSDSEADDDEGYDISQMDEMPTEEFEHMTKQNVTEEVKKGECVRNQLLIWENLLEMRIHMQRCVNVANQMPLPDMHKELRQREAGGKEFVAVMSKTKGNVSKVLDKLLNLQSILLKQFPDTKNISKVSKSHSENSKQNNHEEKSADDEEITSDEEIQSNDEEIPSDTEDEIDKLKNNCQEESQIQPATKRRKLEDYETDISKVYKSFTPFRNSTIQKWNDKTRLVTATAQKNQPINSIIQQIEYILSDREKLLRRTQLKRCEYDIVGYKKPVIEKDDISDVEINHTAKGRKDDDEYIPEIFDDSDFYHQMLRELIECKSADITDPVQLSRQWIALQQMRSKMKRKVDTKATKGRRIKYVVHNQLINFMAPDDTGSWTDETKNELYSSLFGKMFETNAENFGFNGFRLTTDDGAEK